MFYLIILFWMARFLNVGETSHKKKEYVDPERLLGCDETDLVKRFRFNKHGIDFICQLVGDDLKRQDNRGSPIPVELQVLVTLRYLAAGVFQIDVGDRFKISQQSASNIIQRVTDSIASKAGDFIKFPSEQRDLALIKNGFYEASSFPTVSGAIDCTHIRIMGVLKKEEEAAYVNRKNFHSLNVQAVVDSYYRFLHIDCSWPGSSHDSFILRQSQVWDFFENNDRGLLNNSVILGDSGYPLRDWLMVPYLRPNNDAQIRFNQAHSRARVKVEQTFGQLKRRFNTNMIGYRIALKRIPNCIISSCVLHNIAKELKIPEIYDELEQNAATDDQPDAEIEPDNLNEAADEEMLENVAAAADAVVNNAVTERAKKLAGIRKRNEITQNRFS